MANISAENIVGTLLPTAYIDSVKLSTKGGSPVNLNQQNDRLSPHVEPNADYLTQYYRGLLQSEPKSLNISVSVVLKDTLDNDGRTSWFLKNKFVDFLSYAVIVSTSKELTDALLRMDDNGSREFLLAAGEERIPPSVRSNWNQNFKNRLSYALERNNLQVPQSVIENSLQAHLGSVEIPEIEPGEAPSYLETDDRGKQTYNFFFESSFPHPEVKPEHLTVFAYTIFEVDSYFQSLNVPGRVVARLQELADKAVGPLKVNTVIKNKQIISESVILRYVDNNEIYVGPYHTMSDGTLMVGARHGEGSGRTLYSELVPNNSVQDFRDFEDFVPNVVDLSAFQEDLFPSVDRLFRDYVQNNLPKSKDLTYFSNIWMSRGVSGEAKFAFTMNYEKMCKRNTFYPKIINRDPTILQQYFSIQSFKILRKRIREIEKPKGRNISVNTVDSPVSNSSVNFDDGVFNKSIGAKSASEIKIDIPDEIISANPGSNNIVRKVEGRNNVRQLNLAAHRDAKIDIRTYSVSDGSIADITNGKYQYGVEIQIKDRVTQYISDYIGALLTVRNALSLYLTEANTPTSRFRRTNAASKNPHIDTSVVDARELAGAFPEGIIVPTPEVKYGNFDVVANRFTEQFVNEISARYERTLFPPPWIRASRALKASLKVLFDEQDLPRSLNDQFFARVCSPETGSPAGITSTIQLVDKVISDLKRLVGTEVSRKAPATNDTQRAFGAAAQTSLGSQTQLGSADPQKNVFTIRHYFDNESFDASYPKDTGYYYITPRQEDIETQKTRLNSGLDTFSVTELNNRLTQDVLKFVRSETVETSRLDFENLVSITRNLDIIARDKYKFLTPSIVSLRGSGGDSLDFGAEGLPENDDFANNLFTALATQISNLKSPVSQPFTAITRTGASPDDIRDNLVDILADRGVTVIGAVDELRRSPLIDRVLVQRSLTPPANVEQQSPLSISDQFGSNNPVTLDLEDANPAEEVNLAEIIGIHTTQDGDQFNFGPTLMRLMMNVVFDDEDLQRAGNNPLLDPRENPFNFADTFRVTGLDLQDQTLPEELRNLPIAIKSLFLASIPGNRDDLKFSIPTDVDVWQDPLRSMVFYFNFFSTMRLEYLRNFVTVQKQVPNEQTGPGADFPGSRSSTSTVADVSLKDPRWLPLTENSLNNIGDSDILVRLRPYRNQTFKIGQLPGLALDIYNSYFVVNRTTQAEQLGFVPTLDEAPETTVPIRDQGAGDGPVNLGLDSPRSETQVPTVIPREYPSADPRLLRGAVAQAPTSQSEGRRRTMRNNNPLFGQDSLLPSGPTPMRRDSDAPQPPTKTTVAKTTPVTETQTRQPLGGQQTGQRTGQQRSQRRGRGKRQRKQQGQQQRSQPTRQNTEAPSQSEQTTPTERNTGRQRTGRSVRRTTRVNTGRGNYDG
jgi:hypothetical protein